MLYELLMKSLSVKVTLGYEIFNRVLQKLSKECQPMAPNLCFLMISCYCLFDGNSKLTGETNLIVTRFSHFVGPFHIPLRHCCLVVILQLENDSLLPTHMEKNEIVCAVSS